MPVDIEWESDKVREKECDILAELERKRVREKPICRQTETETE